MTQLNYIYILVRVYVASLEKALKCTYHSLIASSLETGKVTEIKIL